jgi:hypothetical protein
VSRLLPAFVAAALALALSAAQHAHAQARQRTMGVRWVNSGPRVSFSARDLVTAEVRRKLDSGLPQTVVLRLYAYPESGGNPIALAPSTCRVAYDIWEEVYRVEIHASGVDRSERLSSLDAVLRRCFVATDFPVGQGSDFALRRGTRIYFAALLELNPLSPDTVQRIRRWLARPGGRLDGDAFFGSFVSLFVNRRIGSAERELSFRSQAVLVP